MNRTSIFRVALIVLVSTISVASFATEKSEKAKFYRNNLGTKEVEASQVICELDETGKYLIRTFRYDYTYDTQNRVVEKRIFKWDSDYNAWHATQKLSYNYGPEAVTIELAYWNNTKQSFDDVSERSIYYLKDNILTSCASYNRKSPTDEWTLVKFLTMENASVVFLNYQNNNLIAEK